MIVKDQMQDLRSCLRILRELPENAVATSRIAARLPTWGPAPNVIGAWSWDEANMLVGTWHDLEIVPRDDR